MADTYMPSKYATKSRKVQIRRKAMAKKRSRRVPSALSLIKKSVGNLKGIGMPETLMVKLSYQYSPVTLTSAVVPYASKNWSINNLYDPDPAVGGVQPPLYDNLTSLYDRWRVVKVRFTFDYTSGTGNTQRVYLAYLGEDTTDMSDYTTYNLHAGGNTKFKLLGGVNSGPAFGSISQTYDLRKLVGSELEDGNYYGGPSTAPATILSAQIGVQDITAASTSCLLSVQPRIDFWVEFNDLKSEAVDND